MNTTPTDATEEFLEGLRNALPEGRLRPVDPGYLEEPRGRARGRAAALLLPRSTEEVSTILAACNEAGVAVIPYSGGTGLVGGQVSGEGPLPVLLSLEKMDRIREVDPAGGVLVAEGGTILATVQEAAAEVGLLFPLSLASEGSARIGGLLATNAGGINVIRYGNTRDLVLGVEAVLADGTVIRGLSSLRKDNTGYDLRHLLIGSEGTLGVITAASLRLFPRPAEIATAFAAVPDPAAAVALLGRMREAAGDSISAFEIMSSEGFAFLEETGLAPRPPVEDPGDWCVLIELGGRGVSRTLEEALATAFEAGEVTDGALAQNETQRKAMWDVRETIPEANRLIGSVGSHDISIPVARIPDFMKEGAQAVSALDESLRINAFGHLGDGNLHYNVFPARGRARSDYDQVKGAVQDAIHDLVQAHGGSISAEHGIGRFKAHDLARRADAGKLAAMHAIKAALDPRGILNPGAVLATRRPG
ncbi:MAG: FAD-binding oxidoreductase [Rubricella sp.]